MKAWVPGYMTDSTTPSGRSLAVEDVAVEVVLQRLDRAARAACGGRCRRRAGAARTMRSKGSTRWRITHSSQKPKRVSAAQFGAVVHLARQHREGRLHRLDEDAGSRGPCGTGFAVVRRRAAAKRHIGLGRHLLQHLARVQLVLAGQHRLHRRARPAHALGQQGGGQGAELLVVGGHRLPAGAGGPRAARRSTKRLQVEAGQAGVAGKTEQVEAGAVDREFPRRSGRSRAGPSRS